MKDHKQTYGIYLRVSMISSIAIFIILFAFVPYSEPEPCNITIDDLEPVDPDIFPRIDRPETPPPENRPREAVEAESETEEEAEETIGITEFTENPFRTIPTGPEIEIVPYYALEIKPVAINSPVPVYPELARHAGIEGVVHLKMLIDVDGSIVEVVVLKSSGNQLLDQSAMAAARQSKFTPARQRDRNVRVWVARKFEFALK